MTAKNSRLIYPTPEEDAEINRQIAEDPGAREWTDEDWANAKSTEELFPEAAKAARKRQADLDAGRTEYITLLLDRDTINWFKAETGEERSPPLAQGPGARGAHQPDRARDPGSRKLQTRARRLNSPRPARDPA